MTRARPLVCVVAASVAAAGCGGGGRAPLRPEEVTANDHRAQLLSGCLPAGDGTRITCIDRPAEPIRAALPATAGDRIRLRLGLAARDAAVHVLRAGELVGTPAGIPGDAGALDRAFTLERAARPGDVVVIFLRFRRGGNATVAFVLRRR